MLSSICKYAFQKEIPYKREKDERYLFLQAITLYSGSNISKLLRLMASMTRIISEQEDTNYMHNMYKFIFKIDNPIHTRKSIFYLNYDLKLMEFLNDDETYYGNIIRTYENSLPCIWITNTGDMKTCIYNQDNMTLYTCDNEEIHITEATPHTLQSNTAFYALKIRHEYNTSTLMFQINIRPTKCLIVEHEVNIMGNLKYILRLTHVSSRNVFYIINEERVDAVIGRNIIMNFVYNVFQKDFVLSFSDDDDIHAPLDIFSLETHTMPYTRQVRETKNYFELLKFSLDSNPNLLHHSISILSMMTTDNLISCESIYKQNVISANTIHNGVWRYIYPWRLFYLYPMTLDSGSKKEEDRRMFMRFLISQVGITHLPYIKYYYIKPSHSGNYRYIHDRANYNMHMRKFMSFFDALYYITLNYIRGLKPRILGTKGMLRANYSSNVIEPESATNIAYTTNLTTNAGNPEDLMIVHSRRVDYPTDHSFELVSDYDDGINNGLLSNPSYIPHHFREDLKKNPIPDITSAYEYTDEEEEEMTEICFPPEAPSITPISVKMLNERVLPSGIILHPHSVVVSTIIYNNSIIKYASSATNIYGDFKITYLDKGFYVKTKLGIYTKYMWNLMLNEQIAYDTITL